MRFLLFVALGFILGLASISSAGSPQDLGREPALRENFYGVKIRGQRVWIVGYYGTILCSDDRGASWRIQPAETKEALFRVDFSSDKKGWIVGAYGTLLGTDDGGQGWKLLQSKTKEHLLGLAFLDETTGWVVGSGGTILHTQDGGLSWTNQSLGEDIILNSVAFVSPDRGWVVGEFGVIYQTKNGGKSWIKQKSPIEVSFASGESRNLFALLFLDAQDGWTLGLDGVILKTTRNAEQWEIARQQSLASNATKENHLFSATQWNGALWAVGERGTVLHLEKNSGEWRKRKLRAPPLSLNDIDFVADGFGLIVGNRGLVLRTEDGGKQWHPLPVLLQGNRPATNQVR